MSLVGGYKFSSLHSEYTEVATSNYPTAQPMDKVVLQVEKKIVWV